MAWFGRLLVGILGMALASGALAQDARAVGPKRAAMLPAALNQSDTYRLWPGRAPGAAGDTPSDTPTLTVYRPGRWSNGTAVIIAPGGAYVSLSTTLEGTEPARWFTARGVTAFVLVYRVGRGAVLPVPLLDGARAVRFVRAYADEFKIDPARIGMMGFSAGGHLAATTAVGATPGNPNASDPVERVGSRPDFLILAYPWLEGMQLRPDGGSSYCDFVTADLRIPCNPKDYASYLPLQHVTDNTPPAFIYHTSDDELVPVEGSVRFYLALRAAKVPAEMHVFQTGPHGTGLGGSNPELSHWPELLQEWMRARALLPVPRSGEARSWSKEQHAGETP